MKKVLLSIITATMLFSCTEKVENVVKLHEGYYAFCGASGAVPTGNKIVVPSSVNTEMSTPASNSSAVETKIVPSSDFDCHSNLIVSSLSSPSATNICVFKSIVYFLSSVI